MSGQVVVIGTIAALALASAVFLGSGLSQDRAEPVVTDGPATNAMLVSPDIVDNIEPEGGQLASADGAAPDAEIPIEPSATPDPPPPGPLAPSLGLVRVDPAGGALVAGEGEPGSEMVLRLDGEEIARVQADARGGFVAMFDLPSSEKARLLTLESYGADGLVAAAADSIVVAPVYPAAPASEAPPVLATRPAEGATEEREARSASAARPTGAAPGVAPATPAEATARAGATDSPEAMPVPPPTVPDATGPALAQGPVEAPASGAVPAPIASAAATQPQPPRLFRVGPEGLTVETGAGPSRPDAVQSLGIDVISYDAQGGVQLAGRGAGDQELRIFLDDRPVRRIRTGSDGSWVSPLPEVDAGTYTLRIETVSADGAVTGRLETPFRRTAPEIAAQARRDGAEAITVQTGYTLWGLSEGYFGDGTRYVQLYEANREQIRDPDLIFPGQIFRLPGVE